MRRVPLVLMLLALFAGCYANVPLVGSQPEPVPGTRLVIELTDQGRVGMEPQVGPGVASVEGALVSRSDTAYDLRVSVILGIWGTQSRWQGERITLPTQYVRRVSERRFSASRTAVAAGAATLGFLAFVASHSLIGGGNDAGPGKDDPPPGGT